MAWDAESEQSSNLTTAVASFTDEDSKAKLSASGCDFRDFPLRLGLARTLHDVCVAWVLKNMSKNYEV